MNKDKEIAMNQTYRQFLNAGMGLGATEVLDGSVEDGLMGFGTAIDEKVFGLGQLKEMIAQQTVQSKDMDLRWEIKPLSHYTSADGNTAVFADDLFLYAMVSGEAVEMYLRFSVVLTYANNQWKVLHWHGSKPENVQSDSDTFGIENWKQKAEALEKLVAVRTADLRTKNRELEIETALEKVRAIAMGMKVPTDMLAVCETISQQMEALGVKEIRNVQTAIFYPAKGTYTNYEYYQKHQKVFLTETTYSNNEKHAAFADDMQKGAGQFFELNLSGDEVKEWLTYQKTTNVFIDDFLYQASSLIYYWCSLGPVALGLSTYEPLKENGKELFKRFSNVFDLAYRRYLDIERAEAQAKEAEIELALERVRARTMAMQQSTELAGTASVLFQQVKELGFETWSCGFCTWQRDNMVEVWMGAESGGLLPPMMIPYKEELTHYDIYNASLQGAAVHQKVWEGEALEKHYAFLRTIPSVATAIKQLEDAGQTLPAIQCYYAGFFNGGYLLLITKETHVELPDLTKRFASVFEQTYTRFLDLQKAEAQAREAQIEAALERVRSRTLAMQKSDELAETSAVLFKQLILLGISPNRLYISIIKSDEGDTEFWITDEDGSKVSMAYEDNLNGNPTFKKMFTGWKQQEKTLVIAMEGEELEQYLQHLRSINIPFKGGLAQMRRWQYIAYFNKGFIGMASPDEQPKETLDLLDRFASVFNLTFTRFNDLQLAEAHALQAEQDLIEIKAAQKNAEDALNELQATQKQLVQSEKMASLGELTAGIAHEIQNPLNFINNFSEVSNELLDEMLEEVAKENYAEANAIACDVKQNLQKIAHHGKRADGIVKGMLQHSRSNTSSKEPTDINKLADEYLRLAYHGLRAKDKSFNATLKTDFDETISNINITPQDIGRVMLNLITNAFYAVQERSGRKHLTSLYEPTVSVSTKKSGDKIEISVADNGNGIPQNIIDKIFQPFFTTKPTGQGTGLGLSLSYDIVKSHGGEVKVETKAGEGSEFIIELPIVKNR